MKYKKDVSANDNNHKHSVKKVETGVAVLTPAQLSLHNNFRVAAGDLQKSLVRTAYYLATIKHQRIHRKLGFASIGTYAQRVVGYTPRQTKALLVLGRKLPAYKEVEAAVERGDLSWTKALEICRGTNPKDQDAWLAVAMNMSLTELKEKVRQEEPSTGKMPFPNPEKSPDPGKPQGSGQGPENQPENQSGDGREKPLNGNPTEGFTSDTLLGEEHDQNQVSKLKSPVPFSPVAPEEARFHVTLKFTAEQMALWRGSLEYLMKTRSMSRQDLILEGLAKLIQNKRTTGSKGGLPHLITILYSNNQATIQTNRGEVLAPKALLESAFCDGTLEDENGNRSHTIPPRSRRLALRNARYRCQAPGCSMASFLEVHHRTPVSLGGAHDPDNLLVLCWRCHRKIHGAEERAREVKRLAPDGV
jgi:hypothetical protein